MGNRIGVSYERDDPTPGARLLYHQLWHEEQSQPILMVHYIEARGYLPPDQSLTAIDETPGGMGRRLLHTQRRL